MPVSADFSKVNYSPAGDSFVSSSKFISSQSSKNMLPTPAPNSTAGSAAMLSMYGLKLWSAGAPQNVDRGIYRYLFKGRGYKVSGNDLIRFDSTGAQVRLGNITGSGLVKMEANPTTLLIVVPGLGAYTSDGASVTFVNFGFIPVDLTFLNGQFVILDSNGVIRVSDPASTTFNPQNTFLGESEPDATVALQAFNQFLLVFGESTVEPWDNTGTGVPPFERMNGGIIEEVGIENRDCASITKNAIFILGADRVPYRIINFQPQSLVENNEGVASLFLSFDTTGAFTSTFKVYSQDVVAYVFPAEGKTWCISEQTGLWFELDSGGQSTLWIGKTAANLFSRQLVGCSQSGNIYELDKNTFQNNNLPMVRERVFRPLSGETLSNPRDYFQMKLIEFNLSTAVGTLDDNPQVMVSYSTDGGRTFSNERWLSLGVNGDYQDFVEDYQNKKFKDLSVKVRYSENTDFSLGSAGIYVRQGGR